MRKFQWLMALGACALISSAAMAQPALYKAAIDDAGRPTADKDQDAERHVATVLGVAGVRPGQKVVDLMPGGGYYTRIWSKIVGPRGSVWTASGNMGNAAVRAIDADNANYPNVDIIPTALRNLKTPAPADVVFTSRNYHDLHNRGGDPAPVNAAVFSVLKRGGTFVILDHRALPGIVSEPLHRIDPAMVIKEVEAAGFKLLRRSDALARDTDPKNIGVTDPSVRGKTDQFILVFRKP